MITLQLVCSRRPSCLFLIAVVSAMLGCGKPPAPLNLGTPQRIVVMTQTESEFVQTATFEGDACVELCSKLQRARPLSGKGKAGTRAMLVLQYADGQSSNIIVTGMPARALLIEGKWYKLDEPLDESVIGQTTGTR